MPTPLFITNTTFLSAFGSSSGLLAVANPGNRQRPSRLPIDLIDDVGAVCHGDPDLIGAAEPVYPPRARLRIRQPEILGANEDNVVLLRDLQILIGHGEPMFDRRHPGRRSVVCALGQGGNGFVLDCRDGHRMNLLVSIGLEETFCVGAVGLVAPHGRSHIMRREQPNRVPERLE